MTDTDKTQNLWTKLLITEERLAMAEEKLAAMEKKLATLTERVGVMGNATADYMRSHQDYHERLHRW